MHAEENHPYIHNIERRYQTMPSSRPHPDLTPDVQDVPRLADRQKHQMQGPLGNFQLAPGN